MDYTNVRTLGLLGNNSSPLEEAIRRSTEKFQYLTRMHPSTKRYVVFNPQGPYLLSASQKKLIPEYNILVTVTSRSDELNREVITKFEAETGIKLDTGISEHLRRSFRGIELTFIVFEKVPEAAVEILKRRDN